MSCSANSSSVVLQTVSEGGSQEVMKVEQIQASKWT